MILLIDNYDSFTHNLYQYLRELTTDEVRVVRNDAITTDDIRELGPERIIISPGPGRPEDAGISVAVVREFAETTPILGVCLGHQAIGYAFGGKIIGAKRIVHGKVEDIDFDGRGLFRSIDTPAAFTRYHSLVIDPESVPDELEVTATSSDGDIMGVRHKRYTVEGVQFHPESIASETGKRLLSNFLHYHREPFVVREVLSGILSGKSMDQEEAANFMEDLTDGNLTPAQIAAFLVGLNAKGIAPEEIAGCASVLQRKRVPLYASTPVLDTCGTGGDGLGTFNISSLSAVIASACGATVAKHGNRAVSSKSGSADFYRALGMRIDLPPEDASVVLNETGFVFLFAPIYHQAMKYAAGPRKELGVKTIMNLLGPLVNPAGAEHQIIGVFSDQFCEPVAHAARLLGIRRVMVVHSQDGLDEISVSAPTRAILLEENGEFREETIRPERYGITGHKLEDLSGGDAEQNAAVALEILSGRGNAAIRDAAILNAAAGLLVYGIASDLDQGVDMARDAVASGKAMRKLRATIDASNRENLRRAS